MPDLTPEDILKLMRIDTLEKTMDDLRKQIMDCADVMNRQTRMLDISLDLIMSLAQDNDVDVKVRRRLLFALQQIRGIGMPS